jgi:hypothetical protein
MELPCETLELGGQSQEERVIDLLRPPLSPAAWPGNEPMSLEQLVEVTRALGSPSLERL